MLENDVWQNTLRLKLCADIDAVFLRRHEQLRDQLDSWMASQEKKFDELVSHLRGSDMALATAGPRISVRKETSNAGDETEKIDEPVVGKMTLDRMRKSSAEDVALQQRSSFYAVSKFESDTRRQSGVFEGEGFSQRARLIVQHKAFDLIFATLILINAAFLGVQLEYKVHMASDETPVPFFIIQNLFSFLFLVELLCRICASGRAFFCCKHWAWNLFDLIVVLLSLVEVVIQVMSESQSGDELENFSLLRILRAVRVIRILRVLKLFKFFRALRVMIHAIFHTLKLCTWALFLLSMLLYMFGVFFTQAVTDKLLEDFQVPSEGALRYFYGSLGRTIFTLFKSMCGGLSWQDAVEPLASVSWFCVFLFVVYISFVYFAVLNVVTGIFCQSALESMTWDADEVVAEQLHQKNTYVKRLQSVFHDMSEGPDRGLSLHDFETHLHEPRARALFKALDIEVNDAWTIFSLLDADGGGIVDYEEFIEGCLQMKGSAKSIHIHQMMQENKWMMKRLHYLTKLLEDTFKLSKTNHVGRYRNATEHYAGEITLSSNAQ